MSLFSVSRGGTVWVGVLQGSPNQPPLLSSVYRLNWARLHFMSSWCRQTAGRS
uniref:Uncharacterized protein n=1 Tax=Anguilla anguilla TaxID=7936 RepID=A0A0E9SBH3_ANGAN